VAALHVDHQASFLQKSLAMPYVRSSPCSLSRRAPGRYDAVTVGAAIPPAGLGSASPRDMGRGMYRTAASSIRTTWCLAPGCFPQDGMHPLVTLLLDLRRSEVPGAAASSSNPVDRLPR
jgi:hypothetical protein